MSDPRAHLTLSRNTRWQACFSSLFIHLPTLIIHSSPLSTLPSMPAPSAAEKQKLLLQQEIAKLSGTFPCSHLFPGIKLIPGQISRHASSSQTSYHPYARGRGNFRGSNFRGRGRGRGRGNHSNVDSRNKPATIRVGHDKDSGPEQESDWIKKTSASGNMSLMTVETK
jgi:hypothetical protein